MSFLTFGTYVIRLLHPMLPTPVTPQHWEVWARMIDTLRSDGTIALTVTHAVLVSAYLEKKMLLTSVSQINLYVFL